MTGYSIIYKKASDYNTSNWSGGTTTELGIGPEGSSYADRDFLWRISSATVDVEETTFTSLPDYRRIIMTLEGELYLNHGDKWWEHLYPYDVYFFDGADPTVSKGKVVDFNLMLRKGKANGEIVPVLYSPKTRMSIPSSEILPAVEDYDEVMIYCHSESVMVTFSDEKFYVLSEKESLWIRGDLTGLSWDLLGTAEASVVVAAMSERETSVDNIEEV